MRAPFPTDREALDALEARTLALVQEGEVGEAFRLYLQELGGYAHLGGTLGDRARGERIMRAMHDAAPHDVTRWGWAGHHLVLYFLDDGRTRRALEWLARPAPEVPPDSPGKVEVSRAMVRIDALLTLGEVQEAEAACATLFAAPSPSMVPFAWFGAGWSPWTARGSCRAIAGRTTEAIADLAAARRADSGASLGVHVAEEVRLWVRTGALARADRLARAARAAAPRYATTAAAIDLASAELALAQGDDAAAETFVSAARARWLVAMPVALVHAATLVEARVALRRSALDRARPLLDATIEAARAHELILILIDALVLDAHAARVAHALDRSIACATEALSLARRGYAWGEGAALHALALAERAKGADAGAHARAALEVRRRIGDIRAANSAALLAS